eukprot:6541972-Karenia_brevis.AAC.1
MVVTGIGSRPVTLLACMFLGCTLGVGLGWVWCTPGTAMATAGNLSTNSRHLHEALACMHH